MNERWVIVYCLMPDGAFGYGTELIEKVVGWKSEQHEIFGVNQTIYIDPDAAITLCMRRLMDRALNKKHD